MRRFYAPLERFQGDTISLSPEETQHLARVLRLGIGDRVEVCDGLGRNVEAVVTELQPRGALLQVVQVLPIWGESPLQLCLGIGLAKGDAMDEVIRQAVEMGVRQILPFVSERSERTAADRSRRRLTRWRRLAQESLKSCQRSFLPEIAPPQELAAVVQTGAEVKLIFWEDQRNGGLPALLNQPRPAAALVLIGPEGGFAPGEVEQARAAGCEVASLGPRRLKVPTAALAALTLLQYAWGDLA
jgi:16S rRNA (uracil1498-N3)-methyltransferase